MAANIGFLFLLFERRNNRMELRYEEGNNVWNL